MVLSEFKTRLSGFSVFLSMFFQNRKYESKVLFIFSLFFKIKIGFQKWKPNLGSIYCFPKHRKTLRTIIFFGYEKVRDHKQINLENKNNF